jgi:transcription-repair coupling factor (superfamily II helicase)
MSLQEQLAKLIPEIRIVVAHGQLSSGHLEDVMTAFYDRKYDLLLSTNIIESGIDIPNANTIVIHRADLFGLAQLYQLRGRVGRSKAQGYAYLTMPADKPVSGTALKRLDIMQTLDKLGAGFTLASHDLDIRGTGNLVGEEQSGHIREVGVELYQHLLQEAIMQVRIEQEMGTPAEEEWLPQINLGTSVMIPETYVQDLDLRLNLYRRIANLKSREEIDAFAAEMTDRFGRLPAEVQNLLEVIEIKNYCRKAHIEKVDAGPKGAVISFKDNLFPDPTRLMSYIQDPKVKAKLRPDHKVVFIREWDSPAKRAKTVRIICANLAKLAG